MNNNKTDFRRRAAATIKALGSYTGCLLISLFVMYYFNGMVGILTAAALICALVISLSVTLTVMPFIKVDAQLDRSTASKGESFDCIVKVRKKVFMPSPVIEVYLEHSAKLDCAANVCCIAVSGREQNTVKVPMKAKYSGLATVRISEVLVSDFLGIFRFRLKRAAEKTSMDISIYPNIPDVPIQTDFLKTTARFSSDDDEEESGETSSVQTGLPGYDHREYYPGDPIKRINWKLSSKRDVYMIRLDEKPSGSGQVFFLDTPVIDENDPALYVRDNVIEAMLAVFSMILREGREIVFFYADKDMWLKTELHSSADVYSLQEKLAGLSVIDISVKQPVPPELHSLGKTPICFTAALSGCEHSALQIVSECPDVLLLCSNAAGMMRIAENMWIISNDFELKKFN